MNTIVVLGARSDEDSHETWEEGRVVDCVMWNEKYKYDVHNLTLQEFSAGINSKRVFKWLIFLLNISNGHIIYNNLMIPEYYLNNNTVEK